MKFLSIMMLFCITLFTSCSSTVVNDAKIGVAKATGKAVTKFLTKEYVSLPSELNCSQEAVKAGAEAKAFVEEKLKVQQKTMSLSVEGIGTDIAKGACKLVATKFLPDLFSKNVDGYICAKRRFGEYSSSLIGDKLCEEINF